MVAREQVLHVARLARLELADGELERFAAQLGAILRYADQLRELDAADSAESEAAATRHEGLGTQGLRPDEPEATLPPAAVIALFPASDGEHVLVPPVLPPRGGS
jgi:aspartyl-tRNA(Asn)/glutamyl-tRNA(Gln) amidotransferase subunit C